MTIAVCTDDVASGDAITHALAEGGENFAIKLFPTIFAAVTYIYDEVKGDLDILYMDERVAGENGIEAAGDIQKLFPELKVVFLTEGKRRTETFFRARPIFLLTKPIVEDAVRQSVERIREEIRTQHVLTFHFRGSTFRIAADSVYYIESQGRKLYLYTTGLLREVNMTMEEMRALLPDYFFQCHRSYIINLNMVQRLLPGEVELRNRRVLPISRGRYEELRKRMTEDAGNAIVSRQIIQCTPAGENPREILDQ